MKRLKNLVTMVAFVVLIGISASAAVLAVRRGLPDLESGDHLQLREQLTSIDLAAEPDETKLAYARQLEQELRRGVDWQAEIESLPEPAFERLRGNVPVAMRIWLLEKVDAYDALPDEDRREYLEDTVEDILRWRTITSAIASVGEITAANTRGRELQEGMIANAQDWLANASKDEKRRIVRFFVALQEVIAGRAFNRMAPGGF